MEYKLHLGDCLEVMRDMTDDSVDAIIADPPYGTTACKWDSVIPFEPMWVQLKRIIKPNGAIAMTACQPFTSALIMSNAEMFRYEWIWEKSKATGFLDCNRKPLRAHENIVVFYGKQPVYNPQKINGKPYYRGKIDYQPEHYGKQKPKIVESKDGKRYPRSVIYNKTAESEGKSIHPTQKPVALMEYLIKTYTNENETVLDFTMGSGTTGIACINTNRQFIGIERESEYMDIARARIDHAVSEKESRLF